jgi:D-alanyl-D-alanine dipeptidase
MPIVAAVVVLCHEAEADAEHDADHQPTQPDSRKRYHLKRKFSDFQFTRNSGEVWHPAYSQMKM